MKFKKLGRTILSVLVVVSMLASIPVFAEEPEGKQQYTITEPYEYPIVPGTPEWEELPNTSARRAASQIPQDILTQMSTQALVETCKNYPLKIDLYLFNSITEGFQAISANFNGFQELAQRPDGPQSLLNAYNSIEVDSPLSRTSEEERFENAENLTLFEAALASDIFWIKLNKEQQNNFIDSAITKYTQKSKNASCYGASLSPFAEAQAIRQGEISLYTDDDWSSDGTPVTITIAGTNPKLSVEVLLRTEFDAATIRELNAKTDAAYPFATRLSNASNKYNCHNYAWCSAPTAYWMNDPSVYMDEIYYTGFSGTQKDDRVYYSRGNHSAIVVKKASNDVLLKSKWGFTGVYQHYVSDGGPYDDSHIEYYRK